MLGFALRFASNGARAYSPRVLFTQGQQGAWYDPSDLATLFQDAAGTIPVTGTGQPVGLMLDKSKGLVRGPELVPNGGFDSGTSGWVAANGTLSLVDGACRITSVGGSFAGRLQSGALSTVPGRAYELQYNMLGFSGGAPFVRIGTAAGGAENYAGAYTASARVIFTATSTTTFVSLLAGKPDGNYADFDNISVRELPGNHARQATAASRALAVNTPSWKIDYDAVDDNHIVTFPSTLGSSCTVARAIPGVGASIIGSQTIGTSYTSSADFCALVIIDRALTAAETSALTAYLNRKAGV